MDWLSNLYNDSWLQSAVDSVVSNASSAYDWIDRQTGNGTSGVGPVASGQDYGDMINGGGSSWWDKYGKLILGAGKTAYDMGSALTRDDSRSQLEDKLRELNQQQYDYGQQMYDAYMQNQIANQEAAAAAAAEGAAAGQEYLNQAVAYLDPYTKFGPQAMEQMAGAYTQGVEGLSKASKKVLSKKNLKKLKTNGGADAPAYQVIIPLPSYLGK